MTDLPSAAIKLHITPENSKWDKFPGDAVIMNIFQDGYFFFCSKLSQKLWKDAPQCSLYFRFGLGFVSRGTTNKMPQHCGDEYCVPEVETVGENLINDQYLLSLPEKCAEITDYTVFLSRLNRTRSSTE